jgi:hypothetical protein
MWYINIAVTILDTIYRHVFYLKHRTGRWIMSKIVVILYLLVLGGPPLWSSGQSSWLQIQRSEFDSQRYHILREVVGLERRPLSFVSTTEELLEEKVAAAV